MRPFFRNSLIIILLLISIQGFSQSKTYKNEIGFKSENDSYLAMGLDRYYTNGLFIHFRSAIKPKEHQDSTHFIKKIWSASIGQYMYNAQSGAVPNINYVDRPFAAYLYAEGAYQILKQNENSLKFSFQVGTIGPSALGKQGQELIHKTFGFYDINGWQYQVNDELGFNSILNLHYLLQRAKNKQTDFSLPIQAELGNTFTGLNAGILFRAGILNPLYHSMATNSTVSTFNEGNLNDKEFYFFLKPSLSLVAYDATIHGGLFRSDKGPVTFNSNPLVFSQEIGAAYAKNRWTVDFSVIFKTKDEKYMEKSEQYGSLDLYYRFN